MRWIVTCAALATATLWSPWWSHRAADEEEEPDPRAAKPAARPALHPRIEAALELRKQRKHVEAIRLLKQFSTEDPPPADAAEALFRIGETYFRMGQDAAAGKLVGVKPEPPFEDAIKGFEDLLKRFPKEKASPQAAYLIGSACLELGDHPRALLAYQRTYADFPADEDRSRALLRIGVCQAALDDARRAVVSFQKYLRDYPEKKTEAVKIRRMLAELGLIGKPAPAIQPERWLNGNVGPEGLKTFAGEVVVVVFFATWCENCSAMMPRLRSAIEEWSKLGVVFLGVANPNDPKNTQPVEVYVEKNKLPFLDVALDGTGAASGGYNVIGMPAAAVLDRSGKVRWRGHLMFLPRTLLRKALDER